MKNPRLTAFFLSLSMAAGMAVSSPVSPLIVNATEIIQEKQVTQTKNLISITIEGYTYNYIEISEEDLAISDFTDSNEKKFSASDLTRVGNTDFYYVAADANKVLPEKLYGTATLTYSQFYQNNISAEKNEQFDAVSTATTTKLSKFEDADYVIDEEAGTTTASGVKDVNVALSSELYIGMSILKEKKVLLESGVYAQASKIVLNKKEDESISTDIPIYYKELTSDGSYSAFIYDASKVVTITDASAEVYTNSTWGDYQIDIIEKSTSYVTGDTARTFAQGQLQGAIIETTDGETYACGYMENLWFLPYEISFYISAETAKSTPNGNSANWAQFVDIQGKNLAKITYIGEDNVYVYDFTSSTDSELYFQKQLTKGEVITGDTSVIVNPTSTLKVNIDISKLTSDTYTLSKVTYGTGKNKTDITAQVSYDVATKTLTLPQGSTPNTYNLTFTSEGYAAVDYSFVVNSVTGNITLSDKTATYTGKAVAIDAATTNSDGEISYKYYSDSACTKEISAPVNVGTYYVKASVAASTNYTEATSEAVKLVINKASSKVTLSAKSAVYTGKAITIGTAKVSGSTGKVTYIYYSDSACTKKLSSAPKTVGTYYVKASVAASTNYASATSGAVKLVIKQASQSISAAFNSKTITYKSGLTYSLKASAKTTLSYKSSNTSVVAVSSAGKITIKGAGSATITVTAKATTSYAKATKTIKFIVKPGAVKVSSVKNTSSKKITVKYAKGANVDGYQIRYVTGSTSKTVTVKNASTVSKVLTGLTKGKTYKISVRTYKKIGTKTYYSSYSSAKSCKVSK